jgi:hypothetical protein
MMCNIYAKGKRPLQWNYYKAFMNESEYLNYFFISYFTYQTFISPFLYVFDAVLRATE